jgi:hypothetical protein
MPEAQEWVTVWTAEVPGKAGLAACLARFERYRARVAVSDARVLDRAGRLCPQLQLKAQAVPVESAGSETGTT